jgi:Restriction endonuclease
MLSYASVGYKELHVYGRRQLLSDDVILGKLNSFTEDEMIEKVVLPLYQKRFRGRFQNVEFSGKDKREDGGIDIFYYEITADTKSKRYAGVQVKQGAINSGKGANGIAAISIQAQQAFTKPIHDITNKKEYRLASYVLLTTGEIQPKARATIVDQFEHKPIDFIDGKQLCSWIRDSYKDEFSALLTPDETEIDEEDDEQLSPVETVAQHIQGSHESEIDDIQKTLATLGTFQEKIVREVMINGSGTTFSIAKRLGKRQSMIEDDLNELVGEGVLGMDDGGYCLSASSEEVQRVLYAIDQRIVKLGYEGELEVGDVADYLF